MQVICLFSLYITVDCRHITFILKLHMLRVCGLLSMSTLFHLQTWRNACVRTVPLSVFRCRMICQSTYLFVSWWKLNWRYWPVILLMIGESVSHWLLRLLAIFIKMKCKPRVEFVSGTLRLHFVCSWWWTWQFVGKSVGFAGETVKTWTPKFCVGGIITL